jgi:hypothetical protein
LIEELAAASQVQLRTGLVLTTLGADTTVRGINRFATSNLDVGGLQERMREIERQEEQALATAFALRVSELPSVSAVWAMYEPSLDVTVVVKERDLETELLVVAMFRELALHLTSNPSTGDLAVMPGDFQPDDAELIYRA